MRNLRGILRQMFLLFGLVAFLSACASSAEPTPTPVVSGSVNPSTSNPGTLIIPTLTPLPDQAPQPSSGRATVVGRVFDTDTNEPVKHMMMFLAEITGEGEDAVYIFNGASSPGTETDGEGRFMFIDVPAQQYVLVVGEPIGYHHVVQDETTRAKVWDAVANQVLDVGDIRVSWSAGQ